jgi:hypothetical protein
MYVHASIQLQGQTDEWEKMNSSINRLWSFIKGTEKKVEGLCLDIRKVHAFLNFLLFPILNGCKKYIYCFRHLVYYIILLYNFKFDYKMGLV